MNGKSRGRQEQGSSQRYGVSVKGKNLDCLQIEIVTQRVLYLRNFSVWKKK